MSYKKGGKTKKHLLLAKLADKCAPCIFCQREIDDEIIYGKLYAIGDIHCHYFCVLLSCCLVQKGKDHEGLFGFLYPDILAEVERSKKHKCSYCGRDGATLGCSVSRCRKQFHLPCGRERDAVTLFYGNYKTFCKKHAPVQNINDEIMCKARQRMLSQKKSKYLKSSGSESVMKTEVVDEQTQNTECVCVICYETVEGYPTVGTFWPPCCARDAWFHRTCLQRMALSAGMHYLKCPLCNEKERFYKAVLSQGYYIPDRDAAWELEQNAFSEIYERYVSCGAVQCGCPMGRDHDADVGSWDLMLCVLCGSVGMHVQCRAVEETETTAGRSARYVCPTCAPAAPDDLDSLADTMEKVVLQTESQAQSQSAPPRRGPAMPSRMSLRRTKRQSPTTASGSNANILGDKTVRCEAESDDITTSRLELNLKAPKKPLRPIIEPDLLKNVENMLLSPLKLLEQGLYEKISKVDAEAVQFDSRKLLEEMRQRFKKPKPLVEKRKIVNDILETVLESSLKEVIKIKEPIREWNSPKKCTNTIADNVEKIIEDEVIELDDDDVKSTEGGSIKDTVTISPLKNDKFNIKLSSMNKEVLQDNTMDIDVESFKSQYLNEVDRDFKSSSKQEFSNTVDDLIQDLTVNAHKVTVKKKRRNKDEVSKKHKSRKVIVRCKSDIQTDQREQKVKSKIKCNKYVRSDVKIKIKWREKLKMEVTEMTKRRRPELKAKKKMKTTKILKQKKRKSEMKQYILKYSSGVGKKIAMLARSEDEVSPIKRRYTKAHRVNDNLVQTSLHNFFKPIN
ncbi:uncharacterized protein [Battus philenor]|uniref:uncharacterized protein n=1 Tax=Battus philenor TaxID=42288 RepID=UPI0035D0149A